MPRAGKTPEKAEKGVEYCTMDRADMFWEKAGSDQIVSPAEQTDKLALLGSNCPKQGGRDIVRRRL
jgi:hypothetical protein